MNALRLCLSRGVPGVPSSLRAFSNSTILPAAVTSGSPNTPAGKPHPKTQPPSYRNATSRKTLLQRLYVSILRSSPLVVVLQHNNLIAAEWSAIRRELATAFDKAEIPENVKPKLTVIHSGLFGVAMRVADAQDEAVVTAPYALAPEVAKTVLPSKKTHPLKDVISGPLAIMSFGEVHPLALKTMLDVLFPERNRFKKGIDPFARSGAEKLLMLAARVDGRGGKILDRDAIKWVSGLGGVDELRGQLVAMLQSVGGGELVRALESVGLSVARTVEGRRKMLEEEANPKAEEEPKAEA